MSILSWLRNQTSNRAPRGRAQHRSAAPRSRPHLEALEDRWMPSFVTVPLSSVPSASAVAVGDFNNDNKLDVASIYTDDMGVSYLVVNLGGGNGHFSSSPSLNAGVFPGSGVTSMAAGNFNKDKYLDLIVTSNPIGGDRGEVKVLLGIGGGRFKLGDFAWVGGHANAVAVGDFNRDGKLDAVVACSTETDLLLGNGTGGFTSVQRVGPGAHSVAVADLNHDGILDLVLGSGPGIRIELGDGRGGFGAPQSFNLPHPGDYATSIALADLNGDGHLDIVTATAYGTAPSGVETDVLLGNGDGTFRAAQTVGPAAEAVAVADFNHDGKLDTVSVSFGSTYVELGNGDGTFQSAIYVRSGGHSVAVGDFNGDGYADLTIGTKVFLNDKQW